MVMAQCALHLGRIKQGGQKASVFPEVCVSCPRLSARAKARWRRGQNRQARVRARRRTTPPARAGGAGPTPTTPPPQEPWAAPGGGGRAASQVPALRACAVPAPPRQVRSTPSPAATFPNFPASAIRSPAPRTLRVVESRVGGASPPSVAWRPGASRGPTKASYAPRARRSGFLGPAPGAAAPELAGLPCAPLGFPHLLERPQRPAARGLARGAGGRSWRSCAGRGGAGRSSPS